MAEKKEKKPLLEALLGSVDGYEILAELAGEKKEKEEEVGEARRPPDTFTGILQGLIPLMILPQLLPLFQQSLAQTLQTATVNVKVESATAIIPVDISATTAIVPIEITASKVILNVNITGQTALLNVNIAGDAMVVIKAQQVGLYLADVWSTILGEHVDLNGFSWVQPFSSHTMIQFEPLGSEKYLVEGISVSYILPKDTNVRPRLIIFRVYTGPPVLENIVASLNVTAEKPTDFVSLLRTIIVTATEPLRVEVINYSPIMIGAQAVVYLYRVS